MKTLMAAINTTLMRRASPWVLPSGTTGDGWIFPPRCGGTPGKKWSRQSEELPIHRVLDMAILVCRARAYFMDAYRYPKLYDEENPVIDRIGLQGDAMTVEVCTDNKMIDGDIRLFQEALSRDDEMLSERLHLLANLLNEAGYGRRSRD